MRNRGRKAPNPLTKTFESNGPDVKVRGTAQHIAEKYTQLSRDAQASGDRVAAENYLQHAEHYIRIILSAQAQFQQNFGFPRQFDDDQDDAGDDSGIGYGVPDFSSAPQPAARFPQFDEDGQPVVPVRGQSEGRPQEHRNGERFERPDRQERSDRQDRSDRQERTDRPERSDRQERPDRQDRRERFARRREAAASRYTPAAQDDEASAPQPSLPAFLTTPVRTVPGSDEQPLLVTPERFEADDDGGDQPAVAVAVVPVPVPDPAPVSAPEAEEAAPRPRRRRVAASTADNAAAGDEAEAGSEAPARKPRVTRTRRKSVDDVSVAE